MTKRPRLSANLRPSLKSRPAAEPECLDHAPASPVTEMAAPRSDSLDASPPSAVSTVPVSLERAADTLSGIFGDAILAASQASIFGWTQALMLQLRLSSYLVNAPRNDRPAR